MHIYLSCWKTLVYNLGEGSLDLDTCARAYKNIYIEYI